MSGVRCAACGGGYDGERLAWCPDCLVRRWLGAAELVRAKHDPDAEPSSADRYRSVLTPQAKSDLPAVLAAAARAGTWYWDRDYEAWVHVSREPLGRAPGVGIPAGQTQPGHALPCLFVADAASAEEAHVFAADEERHDAQVRAGVFVPLGDCQAPTCPNLRRPHATTCAVHAPADEGPTD